MTRKILTALATIGFVLFAFVSPNSAQERQAGARTSFGDRSQENRLVADLVEVEKLRRDLLAAYDESEALIKFFAGYEFLRQSNAMKDYEAVCQTMEVERARIEQMPATELTLQSNNWPYVRNLNGMAKLAQRIRTDEKLLAVMQKAERASQAGLLSLNSSSAEVNSPGVIAAPAYIAPNCNFDDPSNYPSGVDLGIANGIAIALHTAVEAQPAEFMIFCTLIPNPFRIAFAIAAGIVDQVANALKAVATDAAYCEGLRLYVEEALTPQDGGQTALLMNDNFYLTFMYRSVRSALSKATGTGVPTNCGSTRLTEAAAFFDGSDNFIGTGPQRVDAYKKLRAAYHNIGAAVCQQ